MSVWLTIPSARPMSEAGPRLQKWAEMGYKIALWRNGADRFDGLERAMADYSINTEWYAGWGQSINRLIRELMLFDPSAGWFVGGGDDTLPDPNKSADQIARDCSNHFQNIAAIPFVPSSAPLGADTFGVMQPVGDLEQWPGSRIDKFAGSPWIGREFARRVYNGEGPFPPGLRHMFEDEALQCIAQKLGVFWQRPDLTHRHEHWMRDGGAAPAHLTEVNSRAHWNESKLIFQEMKAAGFPGHEPR